MKRPPGPCGTADLLDITRAAAEAHRIADHLLTFRPEHARPAAGEGAARRSRRGGVGAAPPGRAVETAPGLRSRDHAFLSTSGGEHATACLLDLLGRAVEPAPDRGRMRP